MVTSPFTVMVVPATMVNEELVPPELKVSAVTVVDMFSVMLCVEMTAVSPAPGTHFFLDPSYVEGPYMRGGNRYYGLRNFTLHGVMAVSMNAPYEGHDAPSWDGPVRNEYRNRRAYNESEPLPSNAGSRRRY